MCSPYLSMRARFRVAFRLVGLIEDHMTDTAMSDKLTGGYDTGSRSVLSDRSVVKDGLFPYRHYMESPLVSALR